ncbi:probable serine/threonine-protein kinase nek3 [Lineus longissimus]|uniref:probable serine/threonine-protein kinase nek3 n=1 Tax=Lineus longissimus TaxID=88925 RepID=UPI00315C965E
MGDKYKKIELIGSGTFGRVWLVSAEKTGRKYAIKEIQVSGMSSRDKEQALTEVSALGRCKHVNIIRYKEAFVDKGMLNIAMEYADGGDLHTRIKQQKGVYFAEQVVLDWYTQICFGLRYIHGRNILHRDLKTQNIFLTNTGTIKIGDFGIAKILQDTSDHARTAIGTPYYLSPEICQRKPYNHKSDIWASGCVLYELTCLVHPFDGMNFSDLVLKIMQGQYKSVPSHYSALVEDLISILLRVDATKRPSARQILCIPVMQPNVDAYVHRMHHLHVNVCNSLATLNIFEKRKVPDAEKGKCYFTDDEKENVSPETSTLPPKRPRKYSLSTPKPEDVMRDKRSNSAESSKEVVKQNKMSVKNSPKYSLYMDIVKKRREQSPLASLLLKPKRDTPVRDKSKQEPRLSLFVNSEQAKKKRTPSTASQSSRESAQSTASQPLRESTQPTESQSSQKSTKASASQSSCVSTPSSATQSLGESTHALPKAGQSSGESVSSASRGQRQNYADGSVLLERKQVNQSVPSLPKAVSETLERVDKEFEAIKDRVQSLRKRSLSDHRAAREGADRQTETGDGTCDGKQGTEKPEQPKRSSSHDRVNSYKDAEDTSEAEEMAPSGATDSCNPGKVELSKELLLLGRRDSAGSRYTQDSITQSRTEGGTEAKGATSNTATSARVVGEEERLQV